MKPLRPLELPLEGVQLIEASAGTGKTYTITSLFLRLLLEREFTVDQIVVVTFTKAATAELRARVRRRVRDALLALEEPKLADDTLTSLFWRCPSREAIRKRLTRALQQMDEASIFTIHGFCQRMLLEYAFESKLRFDVDLIADQRSLIHQIVQDFWAREVCSLSEAETRFLAKETGGIKDLVSLAFAAIQWPDMPLVVESKELDTRATLEHYLMTRSQAAAIWQRSGEEVRELLLSSTALHRGSYKPETLMRWFAQLDLLFATESHSLAGFSDAAQRLSRSTLARATRSGRAPPEHKFFEACEWLNLAHTSAAHALDNWLVHFKAKLVSYAREQARLRKLEGGLLSFDDLLQQMDEALKGPRGELLAKRIRRKYPVAMIDEFQDTDPLQYAVFSRIYAKPPGALFLIGDPKQAIYAFRGADIFAYLQAAADAGKATHTLDTNYRSDQSLVRALNTLFKRPLRPFLLEGIQYIEVNARPGATDALEQPDIAPHERQLEILFVERAKATGSERPISKKWADRQLPDWVAADIARLLHSGSTILGRPVRPSDIAVLTRTNAQAHDMGRALGKLRIPSALVGDTSVFDAAEAEEMRLLMRAMAQPTSGGALRSALSTPSMGVDAHELATLAEDEQAWERWVDDFRKFRELWEQRGFVHAIQTLLRDRDVNARTLARLDGERRLTNLRHLTELINHAESEQHLGIAGLSSWFDDMIYNPAAREGLAPDTLQIRLESDDFAVHLTTMHKSKGLEYPIVYCPYLWRDASLFPQEKKHLKVHDTSDAHRLKLDLRTAESKGAALIDAEREALAENLRLLYVALTRAQHRSVVVWGAFHRAEQSPLGYLLYQAAEDLGALSETPAARIQHMTDNELRRGLELLEQTSSNAIHVRPLQPDPAPLYTRDEPAPEPFDARSLTRTIDKSRRTSSFSQLTGHHARSSLVATLGKDVDDVAPAPSTSEAPPHQPDLLLGEFPKGARAGELLHSILEHSDFTDEASLAEQVPIALERYGVPTAEWEPIVARALGAVLDTPLDPAQKLRLRDVSLRQRVSEMEFTLPVRVRRGRGTAPPPCLTPEVLARVFEEHAAEVGTGYGESVRQLGFAGLAGFLRGFIDLVFEYNGKFYVVDYKSNHLGMQAADYARKHLGAHMADHHYHLQYHLYAAAVHRYLRARRAGYDYEEHFGGVYYLFLRGMAPAHPPGTGVFDGRPSRAMVEALSALFDGEARAAGAAP